MKLKWYIIADNIKRVKIHNRILKAETAAVLVMSIYKNYLNLTE